MKKRHFRQIDEVRFGEIKKLGEVLKTGQIFKATGVGRSTITRVLKAKDFKDYKNDLKGLRRTPKNASVVTKKADSLGDELSTAVTRRQDAQTEVLKEILKELKAKKIKLF